MLRQHGRPPRRPCCIIGEFNGILQDRILVENDSLVPMTVSCSELLLIITNVPVPCLTNCKYAQTIAPHCTRSDRIMFVCCPAHFSSTHTKDRQAPSGETCFRSLPSPTPPANAAALSYASPLSLVQLTMDRSTALSLTATWLLRQPTIMRSAIDRFTSSPSQTSHNGRPFGRSKRHRSN
jgi:hypothetical protein